MSKNARFNKKTSNNVRGFIPRESTNQFAVLEKTFFPGRFDENGVRKPATPVNPPKERKVEEPATVSAAAE